MNVKLAITALSACALIGGAALAERPHGNRHHRGDSTRVEGSAALGGAVAGRNGAAAVGGAATGSMDQTSGRNRQMTSQRCTPATTATNLGGAAYTNRNTGSAALSTSGTAGGSSSASSSSQGGASASTDPDFGSTADASGRSTANATSRPC